MPQVINTASSSLWAKPEILTFSTGNYNQSSVNENSVGEMLRHTNTGRVSVLNVTHFRREGERGIAVEKEKHVKTLKKKKKKDWLFLSTWTARRPQIRGVVWLPQQKTAYSGG